jgi:hypothetical protein
MQRGVTDYVLEQAQQNPLRATAPDKAAAGILHLIEKPTRQQANMFGEVRHAQTPGTEKNARYIAKPPTFAEFQQKPSELFQRYRAANWKNGYLARVNAHPFYRLLSPWMPD